MTERKHEAEAGPHVDWFNGEATVGHANDVIRAGSLIHFSGIIRTRMALIDFTRKDARVAATTYRSLRKGEPPEALSTWQLVEALTNMGWIDP